jgi:hypothetical protein
VRVWRGIEGSSIHSLAIFITAAKKKQDDGETHRLQVVPAQQQSKR